MPFKKNLSALILLLASCYLGNALAATEIAAPFTTKDGAIIDKNNQRVAFQGVNWFGFNTGNHVLHGLWSADFSLMLNKMKSLGFSAVRIPFSFDFVLNEKLKPEGISQYCSTGPCNQNIPQDSAWNAFKWVVRQFTSNGFYVLIDDHYEDRTYVNQPDQWLEGWKKIANEFKNDALVGYDLYNEPDAQQIQWEKSGPGMAWGSAILSAANAIYTIDPTKLIFVEGVAQGKLEANWGNGFATDDQAVSVSNPKNFFTELLSKPFVNQIVISPHIYGPNGTDGNGSDQSNQAHALQTWSRLVGYLNYNFANINSSNKNGFCSSQNNCHTFPIAVGEFGGKFDPNDRWYQQDVATQINLAAFLNKLGTGPSGQQSWFYWDWNPNSGNTGGILKDDWQTIDCNKVNYLIKYLGLKPTTNTCSPA